MIRFNIIRVISGRPDQWSYYSCNREEAKRIINAASDKESITVQILTSSSVVE